MIFIICVILCFNGLLSKFINVATFLDEVLIVLLVIYQIILIFQKGKIRPQDTIILCVFIISGLITTYNQTIMSVILANIFFLKFYLSTKLISKLSPRTLIAFRDLIFYLSIIGALLQIFFSDFFNLYLLSRELDRGNLSLVLSGFQLNPNYLALTMVIMFATSGHHFVRKILIVPVLAFTGSRTALVGGVILSSLFRRRFGVKFTISILIFLTIISLYFYVSGIAEIISRDLSRISSSIGSNLYIRGIIMNMAVYGSIEHFPFGYGFGNFATPGSWNTEVYANFGISNLHFFTEKSSSVFDSNVSSILGTSGILGLLCFGYFTYSTVSPWLQSYTFKVKMLIIFSLFSIGLMLPIFSNASLALVMALLMRLKHYENSTDKQL